MPGLLTAAIVFGTVLVAGPGAVGELDLAGFEARYRDDGQGQAPYPPAMMVALVFYCLLKGIRSCRRISVACTDDLGAMVICGGRRPHYATVSRFPPGTGAS